MNNIIKRIWNQNKLVQIEDLSGMTFQAESGGHTFQIYGINDAGETVALSGTPSGVFLRPDNTDVTLSCSVSNGVVSATLPAECYSHPGRGGITVFITENGQKTALYAAVVTVSRTSSGNVAPPATQTVVDLVNAISAAVATIPASYSALMADIAPTYSDSALYSVGQYAWYEGDLKRCISPITTAESFTPAHWTSAVLGSDVSDLKSALGVNSDDIIIKSIQLTAGSYTGSGRPTTISSLQKITSTVKSNTTKYNFNLTGSELKQRTGNRDDFTIYDTDFVTSPVLQDATKSFRLVAKQSVTSDKIAFYLIKKFSDDSVTRSTILTLTGKTIGAGIVSVSDCVSFSIIMMAQNGGATSGNVNTIWFTIEENDVNKKLLDDTKAQIDNETISRETLIRQSVPSVITPITMLGSDYTDTYSYINIDKKNGNIVSVTNNSHAMGTSGFFALSSNEAHHTAYNNGAEALGENAFTIPFYKGRIYKIKAKILSGTKPSDTSSLRVVSYNNGTTKILTIRSFSSLINGQFENYFIGNDENAGVILYLKSDSAHNFSFIYTIEDVTESYNNDYNKIIITQNRLTQGGYTSEAGTNENSNRIRVSTLNIPFLSKGTIIKANIGSLYFYVFELDARTGEAGHAIGVSGWIQGTYTLKNDCYALISFATASTSAASSDITIYDFDPEYNVQAITQGYTLESVYDDSLMMSELVTKIQDYDEHLLNASNSFESFLFFTDSHFLGHAGWQNNLEKTMLQMGAVYKTAPVDFCVYGGDALSGSAPEANNMTKKAAMYYLTCQDQMSRDTFRRYYPMVGNHDYNYTSEGNELTDADLIKAMFRDYGESFYTFDGANTLCIVLNSGPNRQKFMDQGYKRWEQISWLANQLITKDAAHTMVLMHIQLTNDEYVNSPMFDNVSKLCEAYNSHTTITLNNVAHDFTQCTGKVELILGGHLHSDTYYGMSNNVPYVMRANTAHGNVVPTFDAVLCDWENQNVFFKKFGDGSDMLFDLTTGSLITGEET